MAEEKEESKDKSGVTVEGRAEVDQGDKLSVKYGGWAEGGGHHKALTSPCPDTRMACLRPPHPLPPGHITHHPGHRHHLT